MGDELSGLAAGPLTRGQASRPGG